MLRYREANITGTYGAAGLDRNSANQASEAPSEP